ncbi:hypothetical protein GCM10011511_46990 [Puia dinghuensis]|uniref:Uncharacterized protein n=2 Tax=Puia dinghuensis TaxID=1792502 RepID=A0A8J2UHC0_9BACT|nr:hypothetical protein GCM10011511_46990 [Puia dinghuensis]
MIDFESAGDLTLEDCLRYTGKEMRAEKSGEEIFSYVTQEGRIEAGPFETLFLKIVPSLPYKMGNDVSKLIISSFFKLNGITHQLIGKVNASPVFTVDPDLYLAHKDIKGDLKRIDDALEKVIALFNKIRSSYRLNYRDFIYSNDRFTYINEYRISNDVLAKYIYEEEANSDHRIILLDVLGEYQSEPTFMQERDIFNRRDIFVKDTSWLNNIVFMRLLSKTYSDRLDPGLMGQSTVVRSFQMEHEMHRLSMEGNTGDYAKNDNIYRMRDDVKKRHKAIRYERENRG